MNRLSQHRPTTQELATQADKELQRLETMDPTAALARLKSLDPTVFEHLTALLFEQRGYQAQTVGTSGDEGVDVMLRKGKSTAVAQCKRYNDSVGQATVRDLYGTMVHNQASDAFLVTTGTITKKAREWAEGKPIHLVDGMTVTDWIMESARRNRGRSGGRSGGHSGGPSNEGLPRRWLWPVLALVLIIFGIAIGLAFTVFADRMSLTLPSDEPSSIVDAEAQVSPTTDVDNQDTLDATAPEPATDHNDNSGEVSVTQTVSPASTATPALTPTTLPACERSTVAEFTSLWDQHLLGCPTSELFITWAAWQPFERGYLFWRSDEDNSYALYGSQEGRWSLLNMAGGAQPIDRGQPPVGLQAPLRGFGYLWSTNNELFENMGWATDKEKGFCVALQGFEQGLILQSTPVDSCTADNLYNQAQAADWRPVTIVSHVDGRWSVNRQLPNDGALSKPVVSQPQGTQSSLSESRGEGGQNTEQQLTLPNISARKRPQAHGIFTARPTSNMSLDGDLAEWGTSGWSAFGTVVWGNTERNGKSDLAGEFQLRWSPSDLWIAIRISDDEYKSGPFGTNMWQGDGLELHLDRALSDDFNSDEMTDDDYQIGINFGPTLNEITAYRWIPFDVEGSIPIAGKARSAAQGYEAEFRLPWSTFGISQDQLRTGVHFGFNLSLNDNDGATPAQQTTMSASPARTDHKTPTEWGTLILE